MFYKKTIRDIDLKNKKVIVRVDYNVPLDADLKITDNTRIKLSLPTINYLMDNGAKIILMSHLGRPKGEVVDKFRLDPAAKELESLIGKKVKKFDDIISDEIRGHIDHMEPADIVMIENVRFNPGETKNNPDFAKELASLAEIYVNDAFGAAHRAHSSTEGIAKLLPAVAGFLLEKEVDILTSILEDPERPFLAVLGGSKISDKIIVIKRLLEKVDSLIVGGGMSYTFLKAKGYEIGKSIHEPDQVDYARETMAMAEKNGVKFLTPVDVVVGREYDNDTEKMTVQVESMPVEFEGMDMGQKTIDLYVEEVKKAKTIFWNGPIGVFEMSNFENATKSIANAIANSSAKTIVGGGDSLAAIKKFGLNNKFFHVSSGGGASMELLEGKELPGVAALLDK